jgi:hypothetical protein
MVCLLEKCFTKHTKETVLGDTLKKKKIYGQINLGRARHYFPLEKSEHSSTSQKV